MSTESVLVSWKPPAEPNGDINQYTVYIKPSGDNKDVRIRLNLILSVFLILKIK